MRERPLLSIVVTSYTMERFKDICDLFDSIKRQTVISRKVDSQQLAVPNLQPPAPNPQIEVIFVAERSRELYEKLKSWLVENRRPQENGSL